MGNLFIFLWSILVGTFKFVINAFLFIIHNIDDEPDSSNENLHRKSFYSGAMSADEALQKGEITIKEYDNVSHRSRD